MENLKTLLALFLTTCVTTSPLFATRDKKPSGKTARVLSINGGGIRGVIPTTIIDELSKQTQLHPSEQFDLIVGTSIGGIASLALTTPSSNRPTEPAMSTQDLVDLFSPTNAAEIFKAGYYKKLVSFMGLWDEKYDAAGLETLLQQKLGTTPLSSTLTPVIATAFELESHKPYFFKSWKAQQDSNSDFLRWHVGRATSAAPVYFEPSGFGSVQKPSDIKYYIDGGVVANNPSMVAYSAAKRLYPDADNIFVMSLDTGTTHKTISGPQARNWGITKWAVPLMDIMFSGLDAIPVYQLKQFLEHDAEAEGKHSNYVHFSTTLDPQNAGMDDVRPENIEALKKSARQTIRDNQETFDNVCETLRTRRHYAPRG